MRSDGAPTTMPAPVASAPPAGMEIQKGRPKREARMAVA